MTESMHTDGPSTPPSGDGPNPIDLEAVSKLLEGGALVTESELLAWAERRGRIPSVPSDPAIGNQNSSSHASGPFDMTDPMYQMTDDGGWPEGDSRTPSSPQPRAFFNLDAIQRFFGITR